MLGQELLPAKEEQHAELAQSTKLKELDAWQKFDVFELELQCAVSKQLAQTRWVLTWKLADGQATTTLTFRKALWIPRGAPAFDRLTFRKYRCAQSKNGIYGVWNSKTRFCKRAELSGTFPLRRPRNGNRNVVTEFGN